MKTISTLLTCLVGLVWLFFFRPTLLGGPATYIIVDGISMQPTFFTGDLVILHRSAAYRVGDVIAFQVQGRNVIHRIVGGSARGGFITQGDNKPEVDPWQPTPDRILGKQWLHIPSLGIKLNRLRSPMGISAIAGLIALMFMDDLFPSQKPARKGRRMKGKLTSLPIPFQLVLPTWFRQSGTQRRQTAAWLLPAAVCGLGLGLACLLAAAYSFTRPVTQMETVDRMLYEHQAVFHYSVTSLPSPLSTEPVIGPVGPETNIEELPPVVTQMAQWIDLDFQYDLSGPAQVEMRGEIRPVARIEVGEEWKQNFPLGESAAFNGTAAKMRIRLPMDQVREWVAAIEGQLGYQVSSYRVTVTPEVQFSGMVDGVPVTDQYAPPFVITFRTSQTQMETELARLEPELTQVTEEREQSIKIWRYSLPVAAVRRVSSVLAAALLLPALLLAGLLYFWMRDDQIFMIQARYGGMLISVGQFDLHQSRQIEVASMKDLARLAQPLGGMIFQKVYNDGSHLYFVTDGPVTYMRLVPDRKVEA